MNRTHRLAAVATTALLASTATVAYAAAGQPGTRMDDLLHPADVARTFEVGGAVTSTVGPGDGANALSACTGDTRMSDVAGADAHVFHGRFTARDGQGGDNVTVLQHVADRPTADQATTTYRKLVRMLKACQERYDGHWYYGAVRHVSTPAGNAIWMDAIEANGSGDGGVVVARSGRHVAVVEAIEPGMMNVRLKDLATATLTRLG